MPEIQRNVER